MLNIYSSSEIAFSPLSYGNKHCSQCSNLSPTHWNCISDKSHWKYKSDVLDILAYTCSISQYKKEDRFHRSDLPFTLIQIHHITTLVDLDQRLDSKKATILLVKQKQKVCKWLPSPRFRKRQKTDFSTAYMNEGILAFRCKFLFVQLLGVCTHYCISSFCLWRLVICANICAVDKRNYFAIPMTLQEIRSLCFKYFQLFTLPARGLKALFHDESDICKQSLIKYIMFHNSLHFSLCCALYLLGWVCYHVYWHYIWGRTVC